jgi:NAD(P)H-dependent flavin oxidoreductase YrpB (nitropropane dioxygenase family)
MGVAVSGWRLARAVSRTGQMGVVSGTALDVVHARRLADGDPEGHLRDAYEQFPVPGVAERVLDRYFSPGGRGPGVPYPAVPTFELEPDDALVELTVLANFAEVVLAREGGPGPIGINYLEKIQLPLVYGLFGAVLAGVDFVIAGAGIPTQVPEVLRRLSRGEPVQYRCTVEGASRDVGATVRFDPARRFGPLEELRRPRFLAIIASHTLARFLTKDPATAPDGFVVEGPTAGGHNAPPRGKVRLDEDGQPVYGPKDEPDLGELAAIGLPFWLAGGYADHEQLERARQAGAEGVQVGTAFALCAESDLAPAIKADMLARAAAGDLDVRTDPRASPSGYPFKVVQLPGTVADPAVRDGRRRVCDLGFLRSVVVGDDAEVTYRCPAEPVSAYVRKGGSADDTDGRACLCNGLLATVGLGQVRPGGPEPAIVTAGDDLARIANDLGPGSYTAADVVERVLGPALGVAAREASASA